MKPELPERIRICMIADDFPIDGRTSGHGFLWPIARALAQRGHSVTVLSWKNPSGEREIKRDGVNAYFLGASFPRSMTEFPRMALEKFRALHAEEPFHLVHSMDRNGYLIGLARKKLKIAMTYDIEATHMSLIFSVLGLSQESITNKLKTAATVTYRFLTSYFAYDRKILKTANGMFVTSPQQKIVLERYYLYPELKTFTVPYGIDLADLSPREKSSELNDKLNLPANVHTVVTVTDMKEMSEVSSLLRAFERLTIKKPSSRLIIVGKGPRFKDLEYEMLNLALGGKVIFTGAVTPTELSDYISLADVFIDLSARSSGFEPSLLEAMAQQKVVIGSEVSPISTIVDDGVDGFLLRPADVGSLATLLIQIFSNQLPVDQIGNQARQKITDLFDMSKMVNQTLDAYRLTLSQTGFYRSQKSLSRLLFRPDV